MIIILCVIFMTRWRTKKRIKIYYLNSKPLQIIHFIKYPLQIPSIKLASIPFRKRHAVPVFYKTHIFTHVMVFICQHIIAVITITKPICKNLIHHRTFSPLRCMKPRNQTKHHTICRKLFRGCSASVIYHNSARCMNSKTI